MLEITKEFTFDAAHQLDWHKGKCKNLHGHTYKLRVTVKGELNENGIIIDFTDLKAIVNEAVIEKIDHKLLNDVFDNPTAEILIVWIWDQLKSKLNLSEISLWETPTSYATYKG
jgi:6-pyruvoyltetrahydropterin/6-carboxytetrahydropterin synthase